MARETKNPARVASALQEGWRSVARKKLLVGVALGACALPYCSQCGSNAWWFNVTADRATCTSASPPLLGTADDLVDDVSPFDLTLRACELCAWSHCQGAADNWICTVDESLTEIADEVESADFVSVPVDADRRYDPYAFTMRDARPRAFARPIEAEAIWVHNSKGTAAWVVYGDGVIAYYRTSDPIVNHEHEESDPWRTHGPSVWKARHGPERGRTPSE